MGRYGEAKVNYGVEGADLLLEYEAKKAAYEREQARMQGGTSDEDEEIEEDMNDVEPEEDDEDEEAPDLIVVNPEEKEDAGENGEDETPEGEEVLDLSKMTQEERNKLKQEVSSSRVFTAADFAKMRKLVEREERARRDPREAARRKRAIAQGKEFDFLSDSDFDSDDDEDQVKIKGAVNPD